MRNLLLSKDFKAKHRTSPKAFVKDRILTFPVLVLSLANFLKGSLQDELDQFFQAVLKLDVARRVVTRSALCQARKKISHRVFIDLLDSICNFLNLHGPMLAYQGMRVFAIDGSTLRLPNRRDVSGTFGTSNPKNGGPVLARVSLLHDVLNRITYDAVMDNYHVGETTIAWQHLEEADLPNGSLILLDRGYCDFLLLQHIRDLGHHFCARMKGNLKVVKEFRKLGVREAILHYRPSKKAKEQLGLDSPLRKGFAVRLIRYKFGKEEFVLMTTLLDMKANSSLDISDLYHQRWQVEESYKIKKSRLKLEDFSGVSTENILQDFHAKVFAECLSSALALELREYTDNYSLNTQNEYKISLTQVLAKMKNTIALLFLRPRIETLVGDLLAIFSKSLVNAIPGRRCHGNRRGNSGLKLQTHSTGYRCNR